MRLNETERLWPIIIIVVSVVFILVHASDSSCIGLYSLFMDVVGRGILCGAFSSNFPFQLSTVDQCDGCVSSWGRELLMAGSDFASYQSSLHLGAGCQ